MLCIGPTGTGKTLTISNKLLKNLPLEYISHFLTFSARTSANQTQDLIDSKLDKRQAPWFLPGSDVPQPGSASCCHPSPPGWPLGSLANCSGAFFHQEFPPSSSVGALPGLSTRAGLVIYLPRGKTQSSQV